MNVSVYLLDWNQRRPWFSNDAAAAEAISAFAHGRYEYSFSICGLTTPESDVAAAELAYKAQGNNFEGHKVRMDRQSMSVGDIARVDGRAYVCATAGFVRAEALDGALDERLADSWQRWTADAV